jgi:hypothetical protein
MSTTTKKLVFTIAVATVLSACQSANLIELNNQYINLVKQESEIDGLVNNGLGAADAATIRTGIHSEFANIGDLAMKSADKAEAATKNAGLEADKVKSRRNEASYLSVAVRSYLSSGRIADHKMVTPARRGIATCRGLTGLQGLPTTCGYFHISRHVGAYNETIRAIRPVFGRALALKPGQRLSTADGKALEIAYNSVVAQLKALTDTGDDPKKINWTEAAKGLRTNFNTQQNKILCNAIRLQARIINALSDATWIASEIQIKTKKIYDDWVKELTKRPVGFDRRRDCNP